VQVGGRSPSTQVATATLTNDAVSGYQKNGIDVNNAGSKAHISKATVTGAGPTNAIAQNGIEIISGAEGKIIGSTITGNECEVAACGPESLTQTQSAGVLFVEEAKGTSVTTSNINENDLGVYHYAAIEPTTPMATVSSNKMDNNRDEGVVLDQGYAVVNKNEIAGGNVGIQLIQYEGQAFGPKGKGSGDTITGTKWAVEGLSDEKPGDEFGKFTIANSKISGNPGGTPATSVRTNNPSKLEIVLGAGNT
jgi:Right handed beta helix region